MEMIPVDSKGMNAVGYDPASRTLHVEFPSGEVYEYSGVAQAAHEELMNAKSKGSHFMRNIRPNYPHRLKTQ